MAVWLAYLLMGGDWRKRWGFLLIGLLAVASTGYSWSIWPDTRLLSQPAQELHLIVVPQRATEEADVVFRYGFPIPTSSPGYVRNHGASAYPPDGMQYTLLGVPPVSGQIVVERQGYQPQVVPFTFERGQTEVTIMPALVPEVTENP